MARERERAREKEGEKESTREQIRPRMPTNSRVWTRVKPGARTPSRFPMSRAGAQVLDH